MSPVLFVAALGGCLALLLMVAFRVLPNEQWQILAVVPLSKTSKGSWNGVNLTYYGFLVATAEMFSVVAITVLITSTGVPVHAAIAVIGIVMNVCVPSSRWIARIIERRQYNFTAAGAVAMGMIAIPFATALVRWMGYSISGVVVFAATAVGYTLGEGIGRLGCISFGCCYGKPLSGMSPRIQNLFSRMHFVFDGATKKIAYESGLNGVPVVPIQAITCCAHILVGLVTMLIFLKGFVVAAFVVASVATYGWRIYSETLRADYRGEGRISKYQIMSAAGIVYVIVAAGFFKNPAKPPDLSLGFTAIWNPSVIIFYQLIWLALFIYHGRSMVTSSEISIHLERNRV